MLTVSRRSLTLTRSPSTRSPRPDAVFGTDDIEAVVVEPNHTGDATAVPSLRSVASRRAMAPGAGIAAA